MLKNKILLAFLFTLFMGKSVVASTNYLPIESNGKKIQILLPDSFCDVTDSYEGRLATDFLNKQANNLAYIPKPLGVFTLCQPNGVDFYPWGYVATLPSPSFIKTQKDLNKMMSSTLDSYGDLLSETADEALVDMDKESIMMQDFGVELSNMTTGEFKVLDATKNAIHIMTVFNFEMNGIKSSEILTISQHAMDDKILVIYLYDNTDNIVHVIKRTYELDMALQATKLIN